MDEVYYSHLQLVTYNLYLQLGVDGLRGLRNFNTDSNVRIYPSESLDNS